MEGRINKIISNQYSVLDDKYNEYLCFCRGKVRLNNQKPKVGDFVVFNKFEDKYAIEKILDRKNELVRPPIANIDQALICMSAVEPEFSCTLVDRLIFLIAYANIKPIIVITKMDLCSEDNIIYKYIKDYQDSGYTVLKISKTKLDPDFFNVIKHQVNVLMGQSGVGKSSLINLIDPTLKLKTNIISTALNRGKHTTRHTELFLFNEALLADTPGFSALELKDLDISILKDVILDFKPYHNMCKFNDCKHVNEPNCKIKEMVEKEKISKVRYQNYLDVLEIIKNGGKLI